ncbi:hypothetical protein PG999_005575 [Apiospora kogelbergensis]|uniref:Uncharacterized protein n=1 Tax=Apiospora kogelbergensis TaxID=1337665 RepID=A0AAW0R2I9_9PEZI
MRYSLLIGLPMLVFSAPPEPYVVDETICRFASSVQITATAAGGLSTDFPVPFGQVWVDIGHVDFSTSKLSWFGWPTIDCSFQGNKSALTVVDSLVSNEGKITLDVGPPQAVKKARCNTLCPISR